MREFKHTMVGVGYCFAVAAGSALSPVWVPVVIFYLIGKWALNEREDAVWYLLFYSMLLGFLLQIILGWVYYVE